MALAGRAAEQVIFGRFTTGASDDLRRVTQIVYQMVQVYGMNERVGQLSFPKEEGGGYGQEARLYSNVTAEVMDEEVREIVEKAYKRTLELMESKKDQVSYYCTFIHVFKKKNWFSSIFVNVYKFTVLYI